MQHAKTGALITNGGEFHVSVPVPRMVLLEIWTQFFWGQEPTTARRNKKVFFFFLKFLPITEPHTFL